LIIFEEYILFCDLSNYDKTFQRRFKCPTKFKKYCSFRVGNTLTGYFIRNDDDDQNNSDDKKRKQSDQEKIETDEQETNKKIKNDY
jgi:hypothetical protein